MKVQDERQKTDRVVVASRQVFVNGEARNTAVATLAALVAELDLGPVRVATALNGDFVPAGRREATALQAGDRVEIVSARQGG